MMVFLSHFPQYLNKIRIGYPFKCQVMFKDFRWWLRMISNQIKNLTFRPWIEITSVDDAQVGVFVFFLYSFHFNIHLWNHISCLTIFERVKEWMMLQMVVEDKQMIVWIQQRQMHKLPHIVVLCCIFVHIMRNSQTFKTMIEMDSSCRLKLKLLTVPECCDTI